MNEGITNFGLPLFTNLLILLVVARLLGEVFERFKQPAMIGEILAGIILGPTVLNLIHRTEEIQVISDLGVFLLVIIAGMEINVDEVFKSLKGKNSIIFLSAFFIPFFSGFAVGWIFDINAMTTVFIGLCIAITALPVSVRILMDLGKINSSTGQKIIAAAILDDVLALAILGVILNLKDTDMSMASIVKVSAISALKLLVFILLLWGSYYLIQLISRRQNYLEKNINRLLGFLKGKESLLVLFFAFILVFAAATELLGFHFIVGAFFGAMLLSDTVIGRRNMRSIYRTTNGLAMGLLAPIFFAGIGLEFDFSAIHDYWLMTAVLLASFLSKILGGYAGGRLAGISGRVSMTIGIGMNARGIMELVIADIAFKSGLISHEVFSILVLMGVLTTLTTPILLKRYFYE